MTIQKRPSADQTRSKILKVAQKLFAKQGFAGTSISDIAKTAKINQSLIYHHFKDKKALWRYVKANVLTSYSEFNEVKAFENLADKNFSAFLHDIIELRFGLYNQHPDLVRMISWQRLEPERKELQASCYAPHEKWYEVIEKFQKTGQIRADLPAELVLNLIWNAVSGLYMDHYPHFEAAKNQPEIRKKYLTALIDCVYRALSTNDNKNKL